MTLPEIVRQLDAKYGIQPLSINHFLQRGNMSPFSYPRQLHTLIFLSYGKYRTENFALKVLKNPNSQTDMQDNQ